MVLTMGATLPSWLTAWDCPTVAGIPKHADCGGFDALRAVLGGSLILRLTPEDPLGRQMSLRLSAGVLVG
jgi:hypothetical protein